MDIWGILILAIAAIAYFATGRRYPLLAFAAGIGAGLLIAAFWVAAILEGLV